jgi:hypothetical protein
VTEQSLPSYPHEHRAAPGRGGVSPPKVRETRTLRSSAGRRLFEAADLGRDGLQSGETGRRTANDKATRIFAVSAPVLFLPTVFLEAARWNEHIVKNHSYMIGREKQVLEVASQPTYVLPGSVTAGTASPSYLLLINETVVSRGGSPLSVAVDPASGEIRTAYFNRSLRTIDMRHVLWRR